MTQKEAVRQIKDWLPQEAIHPWQTRPFKNCKNVFKLFEATYSRFSNWRWKGYIVYLHFSQISCEKAIFHKTPCFCVKIGKGNRILAVTQHLPYKGSCRCKEDI